MKQRRRFINTTWETATYDVWGNAKDGYEVNDVRRHSPINLRIPVTIYNAGTPHQFESATPTDAQLREAVGWARVRIDTDGDDLTIYVNRSRDSYPMGELRCISHASLGPIRENEPETHEDTPSLQDTGQSLGNYAS